MEFKYVDAMRKYNLQYADLPEDAQVGVDQIQEVMRSIALNESRGKRINEKTYKKISAMDKWVYYEILDMVEETDDNEEEVPYDSDDFPELEETEGFNDDEEDESEEDFDEDDSDYDDDYLEGEEEDEDEEENGQGSNDPVLGGKINDELDAIYKTGKTEITLQELKNVSRSAYDIIFKTYDDTGDNGIITANYTLLETDDYLFTLEKNKE